MILLDIAYPGRPYRRPVRDVVVDSVDAVRDSLGTMKDAIADSVSQSQVFGGAGTSGGDTTMLLPMAIVTAALAGCLYLVWLYRRRLSATV